MSLRKKNRFTFAWGAMFRLIGKAYSILVPPKPEGYVSVNLGQYIVSSATNAAESLVGETITLTANITKSVGTANIQWYKDDVLIVGATGSTYNVPSVSTTSSSSYKFLVTDDLNSQYSTNSYAITIVPVIFTGYDIAGQYVELSDLVLDFTIKSKVTNTFQWFLNGNLIEGATAQSYIINDAPIAATGIYTCLVTNIYGSRETIAQYVQVVSQASATFPYVDLVSNPQPSGNAGDDLTITINSATGTAPLTYSWQKLIDGVWTEISTFAGNLVIPASTTANNGNYRLVVTNGLGSATSDVVTATVYEIPYIYSLTPSSVVTTGTTKQLRVGSYGTTPKTYSWQFFTGGIWTELGTGNYYDITNFQAGNVGNYRVLITNSYGTTTSETMSFTATQLTAVFTGDYSGNTYYLGSQTRVVSIGGPSPYSLSWQKETTPGSGVWNSIDLVTGVTASTSSRTFSNFQMSDSGSYKVVVFNEFSSVTLTFTLNILAGLVSFTPSPTPTYGSSELIQASIVSNAACTYQWYKNGSILIGETSDSYLVSSVLPANDGDIYRLDATNAGATFSGTYIIMGVVARFVTPSALVTTAGDNVTVDFSFESYGTPTYSWRRGGTALGTTTRNLVLNPILVADAGSYYETVTNEFGSLESPVRNVTVANIVITTQPQTSSGYLGGTIGLLCQATGPGTLSYQWYKNDILISGATNQGLIFNGLSEADVASYYCIVTNIYGSLQSSTASVTAVKSVYATVDYTQPIFTNTVTVTIASTVGLTVGGIIYVPNQSQDGVNPIQDGAGFYTIQSIGTGNVVLLPSTPPSGGSGYYVAPAGSTVFGNSIVSLGGLQAEVAYTGSGVVNIGGLQAEVAYTGSGLINLGGIQLEVAYVP
jgi:hypothetical protein